MPIRRGRTFIFLVFAGGAGAFAGSVLGAAFGKHGLFGGLAGGTVVSGLAAWIAGRRRWITAEEVPGAVLGAMLGFAGAAAIAVNTLSSPVGPVASTLLIGVGGIVGGWLSAILAARAAIRSFKTMPEFLDEVVAVATRLEGAGHAEAAAGIREGMRGINGLTDGWAYLSDAIDKVDAQWGARLTRPEREGLTRIRLAAMWTVSRR